MKRFKKTAVIMLLISTLILTSVVAAAEENQNTPSEWAQQEAADAIEKELVPDELQSGYQTNIKRYQYVLLALKVFDKAGKNVEITENQPFTDVLNHKYEKEIVKAYNAGIVKGDGKGNFHPDDFITRQEIASLVVNLLKQISPDKDFNVKNEYVYSDSSEISDWAKYYIDFCFENKILNGYGNNRIDPKGNATIEQSIALLYRLAKNEGILDNMDVVEYEPVDLEKVSTKTKNSFIYEFGTETFNIIKEVAGEENVEISSFWDKSTVLSINDNNISITSRDFEKNIFALIHDINDELTVTTYKELLLNTFSDGKKGVDLLEKYFEKMKAQELIDVYEKIDETHIFVIESGEGSDNSVSYFIGFIQRKM